MIKFRDRADGGKKLAQKLEAYRDKSNTIVIGLPRGGVVTAYQIARELHLPLDIIVPRKIGAPFNPELAVGALTQEGTCVWNAELMQRLGLTPADLAHTIAEEQAEAARRLATYRGNRPPLDLKNKTVILVDDGIATGATMRAAIASAHAMGAHKVIVAVPVAPQDTLDLLRQEADEVICAYVPTFFGGVGAFYEMFPQTTDAEVIDIMHKFA